jgi:hypothetical protein
VYDDPVSNPQTLDRPLTSLYSMLPTLRMPRRTTSSLTTRPRLTPSRRPLTASPKNARTLPLFSSTSTYGHLSMCLYLSPLGRILIPLIDRRQDPQPRRRLHPSLPLSPRDPLKGSPLRPGKGQRHEARQEAVWRVNAACPFHTHTYTFNDTPNHHIVKINLVYTAVGVKCYMRA